MAYFIHEDGNQAGPFTIEELKQKKITPSTPVWTDGLSEWTTAAKLQELRHVITLTPPPFSQPNLTSRPAWSFQQPKTTGSGFWNSLRLVAAAILIVLTALYLIKQFAYRGPSSNNSIFASAIDPEHAYPTNYLSTGGTWRSNFWQTEEEISGTITNSALHTNYKDIRIRVNFYSQTRTVIGTQNYIIYQLLPYSSTQAFSLKVSKPPGAATIGWLPTGATSY